jgi:hypothetical protein
MIPSDSILQGIVTMVMVMVVMVVMLCSNDNGDSAIWPFLLPQA